MFTRPRQHRWCAWGRSTFQRQCGDEKQRSSHGQVSRSEAPAAEMILPRRWASSSAPGPQSCGSVHVIRPAEMERDRGGEVGEGFPEGQGESFTRT